MAQTIVHLQRLTSYGVPFDSYTEPHLATDNQLVRNILLALLSSLAGKGGGAEDQRPHQGWHGAG